MRPVLYTDISMLLCGKGKTLMLCLCVSINTYFKKGLFRRL